MRDVHALLVLHPHSSNLEAAECTRSQQDKCVKVWRVLEFSVVSGVRKAMYPPIPSPPLAPRVPLSSQSPETTDNPQIKIICGRSRSQLLTCAEPSVLTLGSRVVVCAVAGSSGVSAAKGLDDILMGGVDVTCGSEERNDLS